MKVLFSLGWSQTFEVAAPPDARHTLVAVPRSCDWGKTGVRKHVHHVGEALRILKQARGFDALVLCTVGIEAFLVAKWRRFLCPRTTIVCADLLMPREGRLTRLVRPWLKEMDAFVCIRKGDIETLERRFAVPPAKCHFAYFPVSGEIAQMPAAEGDYIYSAGQAHRDWPTLVQALSPLPYRAILSPGTPLTLPAEARHTEVLPMQSPDAGRRLMADARVVVLSLEDTDLPSGPLVLLDAMAMGKPVVATDVNGTRDYVKEGRTALLVPPRDDAAMAAAIRRLMEEETTRKEMGRAAREDACRRFTVDNFVAAALEVCVRHAAKRERGSAL